MKQGTLSFQYEEEKRTGGTTGLGGLGVYVEMAQAMGLRGWVERHVGVRAGGQGWRDSEVVMALVLLNLAGGESVGDVEVLEKDEGFCRILRQAEGYGKGRREGRGEGRRWRRGRRRGVLSVLPVSDGAMIGLFDGFSVPIGASLGGVSRGRRRVKPLRGSFASLRPFG